jgi:hypothetical protein
VGAHIGDEVSDRRIGLVANSGNHRDRLGGNRPRDDLLVKGGQVLGSSTAADHQHRFKPQPVGILGNSSERIR